MTAKLTGIAATKFIDGRKKHPLYWTYMGMRRRCLDPRHIKYDLYGARGITICQRWLDDFWAFVADMGPRPHGHTLDRIDPDGPYDPANTRWATITEQNRNRRFSRFADGY